MAGSRLQSNLYSSLSWNRLSRLGSTHAGVRRQDGHEAAMKARKLVGAEACHLSINFPTEHESQDGQKAAAAKWYA